MSEIIKSIKMIQNGVAVDFVSEEDEQFVQTTAYTFRDGDELNDEYSAMCEMLYDILDRVKPNSKHNPYRIKIEKVWQKND